MMFLDKHVLKEDIEKCQKWSEKEDNKSSITTREADDLKEVRLQMMDHVCKQRKVLEKSVMVN